MFLLIKLLLILVRMTKPKNKPNAFLVFCQEWRKKEEKNKRSFTVVEAISNPECNKAWRVSIMFALRTIIMS